VHLVALLAGLEAESCQNVLVALRVGHILEVDVLAVDEDSDALVSLCREVRTVSLRETLRHDSVA
jgi:hypothetical protein